MSDLDVIAECVKWICSRVENYTSEEEVERLVERFALRRKINIKNFKTTIKKAIFEEPITLSCFFPEKLEKMGVTLYSSHGVRDDKSMKFALNRANRARRILDSYSIAKKILSRFFEVECIEDEPYFLFNRKYRYRVFISTVDELEEDLEYHLINSKKDFYVVILLTESTPLPFIKFFKNYSEKVRGNFMVWVMDVDREVVDPFIGYPPEGELINKFRNPKLATKIASLWRVKVRELD